MSHFTVMVIGDNVDAQLAPFQENNMGDCPAEFMEFTDTEDEFLSEYNEDSITKVVMPDGTLKNRWEEGVTDDMERRDIPFKELYATFEEFVSEYHSYEARDEKTGRYGYWENPNRKWDWYQVGGRWSGFLKLKPGAKGSHGERSWMNRGAENDAGTCDSALKGAIDFEAMRQEAGEHAADAWDKAHELFGDRAFITWDEAKANCTTDGTIDFDKARAIYNAQEPVKAFNRHFGPFQNAGDFLVSREQFIADARATAINTFAVLKDGEWYEKGEMGWWGMSDDKMTDAQWATKIGELLDGLSDETPITIVDCHI